MGWDRPYCWHCFPYGQRIGYHWGDSYPGSVDGPVHPTSGFQASKVGLIMADRVIAVGNEVRRIRRARQDHSSRLRIYLFSVDLVALGFLTEPVAVFGLVSPRILSRQPTIKLMYSSSHNSA